MATIGTDLSRAAFTPYWRAAPLAKARRMTALKVALLAASLAVCVIAPARAEDASAPSSYQNLLTPLIQGAGTDILGDPLKYPDGPVKITAAIVTIPPGGQTGWHEHEVPLFAYILEGELTVDYGDKGTRIYRAGDSVLEAVGVPHNGTNSGAVPVKLLAVYMGGGTATNTKSAPAP